MPMDHSSLITVRDALQVLCYLVTIIGVPIGFWRYSVTKKRERVTREKEAFTVSNKRYAEYLELLLTQDNHDMFDLAESLKCLRPAPDMKSMILMAWMITMLETAYVWYAHDQTTELKEQWLAWDRYVEIWTKRQDFRFAWPHLKTLFHDSFIEYIDSKL